MLIKMLSNDVEFEKCGDIILAPKSKIFALTCSLCNDVFLSFKDFKGHIFLEHDVFLGLNGESESEEEDSPAVCYKKHEYHKEIQSKSAQDVEFEEKLLSFRNKQKQNSGDGESLESVHDTEENNANVETQADCEKNTVGKGQFFQIEDKNDTNNQIMPSIEIKPPPLDSAKSSATSSFEILSVVELPKIKLSPALSAKCETSKQQSSNSQMKMENKGNTMENSIEQKDNYECAMDVDEDDCAESPPIASNCCSEVLSHATQISNIPYELEETVTKIPDQLITNDGSTFDDNNTESKIAIESQTQEHKEMDQVDEKQILACGNIAVESNEKRNVDLLMPVDEVFKEQITEIGEKLNEGNAVEDSQLLDSSSRRVHNIFSKNEAFQKISTNFAATTVTSAHAEVNHTQVDNIKENLTTQSEGVTKNLEEQSFTATYGFNKDDNCCTDGDEEPILSDVDVNQQNTKLDSSTDAENEANDDSIEQIKVDDSLVVSEKVPNSSKVKDDEEIADENKNTSITETPIKQDSALPELFDDLQVDYDTNEELNNIVQEVDKNEQLSCGNLSPGKCDETIIELPVPVNEVSEKQTTTIEIVEKLHKEPDVDELQRSDASLTTVNNNFGKNETTGKNEIQVDLTADAEVELVQVKNVIENRTTPIEKVTENLASSNLGCNESEKSFEDTNKLIDDDEWSTVDDEEPNLSEDQINEQVLNLNQTNNSIEEMEVDESLVDAENDENVEIIDKNNEIVTTETITKQEKELLKSKVFEYDEDEKADDDLNEQSASSNAQLDVELEANDIKNTLNLIKQSSATDKEPVVTDEDLDLSDTRDSKEPTADESNVLLKSLLDDSNIEDINDVMEQLEAGTSLKLADTANELLGETEIEHAKEDNGNENEEQLPTQNEVDEKAMENSVLVSKNKEKEAEITFDEQSRNAENLKESNLDEAVENETNSTNLTTSDADEVCSTEKSESPMQKNASRLSKFFEELMGDELDLDEEDDDLKSVLENLIMRVDAGEEKAEENVENPENVNNEADSNTNEVEEYATTTSKQLNNETNDKENIKTVKEQEKHTAKLAFKNNKNGKQSIKTKTSDATMVKSTEKTNLSIELREEVNESMRLVFEADDTSLVANESLDAASNDTETIIEERNTKAAENNVTETTTQNVDKETESNANIELASKKRKRRLHHSACRDSPKRQKIVENLQTESESNDSDKLPNVLSASERASQSPKNSPTGDESPTEKASIQPETSKSAKKPKNLRSTPKKPLVKHPSPVVRIKRIKIEGYKTASSTTESSQKPAIQSKVSKATTSKPKTGNLNEQQQRLNTSKLETEADNETDDIINDILANVSGELRMTTEETSRAIFGDVSNSEEDSLEPHRPINETFNLVSLLERVGLAIMKGGEFHMPIATQFADILCNSELFKRDANYYKNTELIYEILKNLTKNTNEFLASHDIQPFKIWEMKSLINCMIDWLFKVSNRLIESTPETRQCAAFFSFAIARRIFLCENCTLIFTSEPRYESHLETHTHPGAGMTCPICLKTLKRAHFFDAHVEKCKTQSLKK